MSFKPLLKDPLTHFLAAGILLFLLGSALRPPEADERRIVVDRAALLEFIQFRSKAFEPNAAESLLDSITGEARERLIEDYVEEEALYREARALGLDANDYVIKQRLVQKLDFLSDATTEAEASEEEIAAWYEAHRDEYALPASATFAHVFFTNERRGAEAATALAAAETLALRNEAASFEDAVARGERFPFHTNYAERTYDYIESQFGEDAARRIFSEEGPFNEWRGPIVSPYGAHAIFVKEVTPARHQPLSDVRERVRADAAASAQRKAKERILRDLVAQYEVSIDLDPPKANAASSR